MDHEVMEVSSSSRQVRKLWSCHWLRRKFKGYHSPDRENPWLFLTLLDEIAGNMSNNCTFINPNSPRTSRMKNELKYEKSARKLFCCAASIKFPWLHKFPDFPQVWSFHWPQLNSLTFPGFQEFQKNGNPASRLPRAILHTSVVCTKSKRPHTLLKCSPITCQMRDHCRRIRPML